MKFLATFDDWNNTEAHPDGAVIFSEDDSADSLYLVLEGKVDLSLRGQTLSTEGRGSLIGEMALLGKSRRGASAQARGPVRLARISRSEFRELVADDPELSLHAMAELAKRLRAVDGLLRSRID